MFILRILLKAALLPVVLILLLLKVIVKVGIFNASTCGDNCAKWFLKIAEKEDRTINLRHIMDFGEGSFEILVLNSDIIVHSQKELVEEALDFL